MKNLFIGIAGTLFVVTLAMPFLVGYWGDTGEFKLTVASNGTNYVFPLKDVNSADNAVLCGNSPQAGITLERNGTAIRGLEFCGTVVITSNNLREVQ